MKNFTNLNKGFTLIELLVVVAIIGLLSSVVLASLNSARVKGRDTVRMSDMREIQKAIELYYNDTGHYPIPGDVNAGSSQTDADCWQVGNWISDGTNFNWSTGYISKQPHDPINNCYWPWGNGSYGPPGFTPGSAGTYEYWSNGQKYLIAARFENIGKPYISGVTGIIDPRFSQPYSTYWTAAGGATANYVFVVTNQ